MKSKLTWSGLMGFEAIAEGNAIKMDAKAPLGQGQGPTPKELVGMGLAGCTAMDVVALMKKHKQVFDSFFVEVDIATSTGVQPAVFVEALLTFNMNGSVDKNILIESVKLSQTKYCGVSAMLSKSFPIKYVILLNNEKVGEGQAAFV